MPDKTPSSISGFYDGIFNCYETANTLLTLGLNAYWRKKAAKTVLAARPGSCLDVCTGTGGLAVLIHELSRGRIDLTGLDFNESMLSKARARTDKIRFLRGEAGALPFPDATFDAVTVSFAARNLAAGPGTLPEIFKEFRRVLKPGGLFVNLETSRPGNIFIRKIFYLYVNAMTALAAVIFPKSKAAYSFLASSIHTFHSAQELTGTLLDSGFASVETAPSFFGAVAVHKAVK
ncbi:MAG: ubiquinone/menaquinone biosynthesis methyltransferase [Elusimicrobiales bacterium]|jgi:demethylmenaquinone methyltransferase/2-methoxy-6-polyprenyl-1,4-benzoquinol methylase